MGGYKNSFLLPEGIFRRKRFGSCYVKPDAEEFSFSHNFQQGFLVDKASSASVYKNRVVFHKPEPAFIKKSGGFWSMGEDGNHKIRFRKGGIDFLKGQHFIEAIRKIPLCAADPGDFSDHRTHPFCKSRSDIACADDENAASIKGFIIADESPSAFILLIPVFGNPAGNGKEHSEKMFGNNVSVNSGHAAELCAFRKSAAVNVIIDAGGGTLEHFEVFAEQKILVPGFADYKVCGFEGGKIFFTVGFFIEEQKFAFSRGGIDEFLFVFIFIGKDNERLFHKNLLSGIKFLPEIYHIPGIM